jgi:hypothetical protein
MKTTLRNDSGSLNASFNGDAFLLDSMEGFSIATAWTETAGLTGSFKLQASNNAFNDNPAYPASLNVNASALWADIPGSTVAVAGSGTQFWNVSDVYYRAVRIVWTNTAGTGTYAANIWAKGIQ